MQWPQEQHLVMTATPLLPQALKTWKPFLLQDIQILPDHGAVGEGQKASLLFRFYCTVFFVLWLLLLLWPAFLLLSHLAFPKASYRCQRIPEIQELPSSVWCIYQLFLKMSATHHLKIKGSLAWPAVHIILYPTPLFFLLPPTQQIEAPCSADTPSWAQP